MTTTGLIIVNWMVYMTVFLFLLAVAPMSSVWIRTFCAGFSGLTVVVLIVGLT